ncbi:CBS domain-containing protein (plasmid) [Ruegeria sp. SCSIO 43209]|uniref:CBS domain-containing protein n=1 Tax=Ruegeria sp. SCSIO 43209 TaxID=2793010 RepID=UPI00147AEAD1|nr:CBS domain-containing protein [Ruegeria sp. SCSIO 43209]UAB91115.1 CBS domain-containing protein [Ruegeria sp. SCSIO 43209]
MTISSIVEAQDLKRRPFCDADTTVFDAAVAIALLEVNALAVLKDEKLVGIITDHDVLLCLADSGSSFYEQTVDDWMTEKPITCATGSKLSTALNLMAKHDIRNLVVTQRGEPYSVVSSKEILARIHEEDELELKVLRDKARSTQDRSVV